MSAQPIRFAVALAVISLVSHVSAATTTFDPYVPGEGKDKIAMDLGVTSSDILVDRRCVYTRTAQWVESTTAKTMSTCTVLALPTRLIVANYDKSSNSYVVDLSFDYAQIKSVALASDSGKDTSMYTDGRKIQVQLESEQGFISLTAYRSPAHVKPFDERGADDLFELMKSKGVTVAESKGLVDVRMTTWTLIPRK